MGARSTVRLGCALGALLAVAGCQEFGGPIGGTGATRSPQDIRVQALETRVENLTSQGQSLMKLEAEVRALRGEVERMRYDLETGEKRSRELYQDLDRRLARIENEGRARLSTEPRISTPPPASGQDEEATYLTVFEKLKARKYDDSIAGFRNYLSRWPQGDHADNAWYWLGESHYLKKNYDAALDSFRSLMKQFPDSAKAPDALFKIGLCQAEKKQKGEARASWQKVVADYPNSSAAGLARQQLEQTK